MTGEPGIARGRPLALAAQVSGWTMGAAALAVLVCLSLAVGKFPVAPGQVLMVLAAALTGGTADVPASVVTVVLEIRLPRVAAALLVGAALAAAGATYQGLFRNPLVSPDILGVSAGASLGAVLGIFLSLGVLAIQGLAFAGGLVAVAIVYLVAAAVRRHDPVLVLVLAGVAVGSLLGAAVSLLKILADPYDQLPAITFWLLGSLASITRGDVWTVAPAMALGLVPLVLLRWRMNLMTLGEEEARSLGVETGRLRAVLVAGATLITATAVSIAGAIGWIGLVVPHVARLVVGPDFTRLLPASLLMGAGYLLLIDTLARTIAAIEVPLGILTAALGAPFFLWLLATARRGWS